VAVCSAAILPSRHGCARTAHRRTRRLPLLPVRADGVTVHDLDGRAYLDCVAGAGTLVLGHGHPAVIDAVRRALARPDADRIEAAFTAALRRILPPGLGADATIHAYGANPARAAWHPGLVVADETLTGLGRTGELWAVDHAGVTPDVLVLPRAIGGGLPLAAVACRAGLSATVAESGDFVRDACLAMAAGIATVEYVLEHDLATRARKVGEYLSTAITEAARGIRVLGAVHGTGLLLDLDILGPDAAPDPAAARAVRRAAQERGLLVDLAGSRGTALRLTPPLTIADHEAEQVAERLTAAAAAVHDRQTERAEQAERTGRA
jgi:4-aminobutyrate aminotransferase-like enzyme